MERRKMEKAKMEEMVEDGEGCSVRILLKEINKNHLYLTLL
jgi:hypothetical protein